MSVELFKHNKETYENIIKMFDEGTRVGVVQPTGSGKSFLFLKWIEDHPDDNFIILSPSVEIFTQLKEYAESTGDEAILNNCEMLTYQTLLRKSDDELNMLYADKIIIDEFHRTGADLWGTLVQRILKANPQALILGATATPIRYLDGGKNMAEELFDNRLARYMTLGEAVAKGILPEPVYVPIWYDMDGRLNKYQRDINSISDVTKRKVLDERLKDLRIRLRHSYGAADVFKKYMPDNHGKYIVFCSDYDHLLEMQDKMKMWLMDVNENIHTYISISRDADRDQQLNQFKQDNSDDAIKLLYTIDRLNEGVHVKGIDGVIMLRPTISPIIYLQQMGRALASGQKNPVIFDMVNNFENVQIFNDNDEEINIFVKEFIDGIGDNPSDDADTTAYRLFEQVLEFNNLFYNLENILYIDNDRRWQHTYELVKEYIEKFNKNPIATTVYKGVNIGMWLNEQNRNYKRGSLLPSREEMLREIGVILGYKKRIRWNEYYNLLQEYIAEFKDIPSDRTEYKDYKLGKWLYNQRTHYNNGKMSVERVQLFKELGINFDDLLEQRWLNTFNVFEEYVKEAGSVPTKDVEHKGLKIGIWFKRQLHVFKTGSMLPQRKELFDSIGVNLDGTFNKRWDYNFALLNEYIKDFNEPPSISAKYKDVNIGTWFKHQKENIRDGKLSQERENKLRSLGIDLSIKSRKV